MRRQDSSEKKMTEDSPLVEDAPKDNDSSSSYTVTPRSDSPLSYQERECESLRGSKLGDELKLRAKKQEVGKEIQADCIFEAQKY